MITVSFIQKMLITYIILFSSFVLTLFVMGERVWVQNYENLEEQEITENIKRVSSLWENEQDKLLSRARDWAEWDDMYQFAQDPINNQKFIDLYFTDANMQNLAVDFVAVIDDQGNILYAKNIGINNKWVIPFKNELLNSFVEIIKKKEFEGNNSLEKFSGFVRTSEYPVLVSGRRIANSDYSKKSSSILIYTRNMDQSLLSKFDEIAQARISFVDKIPNGSHQNHDGYLHFVMGHDVINGYFPLKDLNNKKEYFLEVSTPRAIYNQGQEQMRYFIILVSFFGTFFSLFSIFLFKRIFVARFQIVNKFLSNINKNEDYSSRLKISGNDEFVDIAVTLNDMLDHINDSQERVKAINNQLELSNRFKSEFISNFSHESRTPMNAILGYAQILQEDVSEEQKIYVKNIIKNGNKLLEMLSDLVEISLINSGHDLASDSTKFPLESIFKEINETYERKFNSKNIDLIIEYPSPLVQLCCDFQLLKKVFYHVINNAIKFTQSGSVRIYAETTASTVTCYIQDTGVGIKPEKVNMLIQMFAQIDGSYSRQQGGIGLGLYLSHSILKQMGGTLSIESQGLEKGTTVTITLPLC
ncbi:signal transduction histidine kinase [Heliophilum fasciatum]|uniref:histidine kinase n=1 Tax=Heliophilum fasciatum TaxID=35700 RepID=A0A4R2RW73_9FIRM|nr:signal transduction histidine kinase [Heliophilum fasciatum]